MSVARPVPRAALLIGALGGGAALALVLAAALGTWSGALTPTDLVDAGDLSRYGLSAVTTLGNLAAALTVGGLALAAAILPAGEHRQLAFWVAGAGGVAWTLLLVARIVFQYSVTSGTPVGGAGFGAQLLFYARELDIGRALTIATVFAAIAATVAIASATPTGAGWGLLAAGAAFFAIGETGHAAGDLNHMVAVSGLVVHLAGAAVWIGGLAALAAVWLSRSMTAQQALTAVRRYSPVAAWCLVLVGASGVLSAVLRVGGWAQLTTTRYGVLVLAKVGLIGLLAAFGWWQRTRVLAGLSADARPVRPRSVAASIGQEEFEAAAGTNAAGTGVSAGGAEQLPARARLLWRLAAGELLIMGAVSGVAVALGGSPTPVQPATQERVTPAEIVTGHALPPEPTFANWFTQSLPDMVTASLTVAGIVVYLRWVWRLRSRGDGWPVIRTASWLLGMVLFGWVTNGGPAVYGHVLFSGHMVQHMLLAMVIPIFIASAAPVTLAMRALPVRKDGSRGPREWLLTLVHSRWGSFLAHPIVAGVNFAGSLIVFYYTPLFEWSLRTTVGHLAMVAHFSLAGYLFVNALIGIDPGPTRPPYPQRLLLLLATMAFHAFFGVTLMSGDSLLVASWFGLMGRPWGASAIADQHTGGAIAWGIGEIPTIILAVVVAVRWAASDERTARRLDRKAARDGDRDLAEYNEMLARLAQRDRGDK